MREYFYSAGEAANILGICLNRMYELAKSRRRGRRWNGMWQFTDRDIQAMTVRVNGRPKKVSRK